MAVPQVTCSADVIREKDKAGAPQTLVQLGATATGSPFGWTWSVLSAPPGASLVGAKGDFTDGVANVQNPELLIDGTLDGTYCIQCVASNADGASDPTADLANAQQLIVVKTRRLGLQLAADYAYGWGDSLVNPAIRALESQAIWEWNGEDLSQFLPVVSGSAVESASVTYMDGGYTTPGHVPWIKIEATTILAAPTDEIRFLTVLPIDISPIPDSYLLVADVVYNSTTGSGAALGVRLGNGTTPDLFSGYVAHQAIASPYSLVTRRIYPTVGKSGTLSNSTIVNEIPPPAYSLITDQGFRLGLGVEGHSVIHQRFGINMVQYFQDDQVSDPDYDVGHPAIGILGDRLVYETRSCFFRNIRILPLSSGEVQHSPA